MQLRLSKKDAHLQNVKMISLIQKRDRKSNYPQVEWKKIKGIRDFISHHYFDLDAEVIFSICQDHVAELLFTLKTIKTDLQ